jgi:hypothetical protein
LFKIKKAVEIMKKLVVLSFILLTASVFFSFFQKSAGATVVTDNINGVYTDNFFDNTGLVTRSGTGVSQGKLQLLNASNGTTTPYVLSGYAIVYDTTNAIWPLLLAKWGTLTFDAVTSATTSIKVQVVDGHNVLFPDSILPGNSTGFSSSPIDISNLSTLLTATSSYSDAEAKNNWIRFKITLSTTNGKYTPTVDNLRFTWTTAQGDLSSSTLATSPWPTTSIHDNQGTAHTPYYPDSIYPALKSMKDLGKEGYAKTIIGKNNIIYSKTYGTNYTEDPVINPNSSLRAINSLTGRTIWERKITFSNAPMVLSENGTIYLNDSANDNLCAINAADGTTKWCHVFYGGHSSGGVSLGNDGTVYYVYSAWDTYLLLYAFRPDGSIKWTRQLDHDPSTDLITDYDKKISFNSDGDLYVGTVENDNNWYPTNKGHLYIISHIDGSILHTVNTGDIETANIVIDQNDVAYVGNGSNYDSFLDLYEARILAVNKDGTIKWTYRRYKSAGWHKLSLRSDGVLMAREYWNDRIYALNTSDGSVAWQASSSANLSEFSSSPGSLITNGLNGSYFCTSNRNTNNTVVLNYLDAAYNQKWKFTIPGLSGIGSSYSYNVDLNEPVIDDHGNIFINYDYVVYDNTSYNNVDNNIDLLSFVPWHLSFSSNLAASYYRGNTINITAKSSMPAINPFNNEANKVQAVVDGNIKIPLTYGATDPDGNTLWTGSYTIPQSSSIGNHNIVLEAAQSMITTDASTTFATYPSGTNNTGIRSTSTFALILPNSSSLPSGYNAQPGQDQPKNVFKVTINNSETTTDNRTITLNLTASPDTKNIAISENQNFQFASLEPFTPTKQFQLSSGNGFKTIYVKFYTQYGFSTPAYQASIVLNQPAQTNQPIISTPSLPNPTTPPVSGGNSTANPGQSVSIPIPTGNITANLPVGFTFQHTLQSGQTNSDIRQLQQFLTSLGSSIYPAGKITGYFGPLTRQAVIRFQEKYAQEILVPLHLKKGTGLVGPATLKQINALLGR